MADSIQASSSIPLPQYQTVKGDQDPLPLASSGEVKKSAVERSGTDAAKAAQSFKDYLDQTSISTVERQQRQHVADPADMIMQNSVYGQTGISSPL